MLKGWSLLFDHEREQLGAGLLWVRLSGLPLHFWFEDFFNQIGNAVGTFLDYDKSYVTSGNKIDDSHIVAPEQ